MKPPHDHEQYMKLPQKFQGRGLEDEDSLSHATDVEEGAIMLKDMHPHGTPVRAVQVEVYTRVNNIRIVLTNFQSIMFPVMCYLVVCTYTAPVSCLIDTGAGISLLLE